MSTIRQLKFTTAVDLSGWSRDIATGGAEVDRFVADVQDRLGSIKGPALDLGSVAPAVNLRTVTDQAAPMAAAFAPLGNTIRASLASAFTSLTGFARRFSSEFEEVGAIVEKLAIRIDSAMRFPAFLARAEKARAIMLGRFGIEAEKAVARTNKAFAMPPISAPMPRTAGATGAPNPSGWTNLGAAAAKAMDVARSAHGLLGDAARRDAKDVNHLIGTWLGIKKIQNVVSTFGSVASASFGKVARMAIPKIAIDPRQSQIIRGMGNAADTASGHFRSLGVAVLGAFGVFSIAFKVVDFFKQGIVGAVGLNETLSKTDVVLGSASKGVKAFADDMASRFGIVKQETLDVASGFGSLFKKVGLSGDALGAESTKFAKLAADLSSQGNISFADAGKGLRAVLSGNESDELKKVGVFTDEATIKAYAYSHGIAKLGDELTRNQKIMAAAGSVMEQSRDVQGDLENTADSTANQFRKFTGNIKNLAVSVGTALTPAIDQALSLFNELASWATTAFDGARGAFGGLIDSVSVGFSTLASAVTHPKAAFEVLRLTGLQALTNIGEYLDTLGPNFAMVGEYIGRNWKKLFVDIWNAAKATFTNIGLNLHNLGTAIGTFLADPTRGFEFKWTGLLDGFKKTAEKLPELIRPALTDMTREIAAAGAPIMADVQRKADEAKARAEAARKAAAARDARQNAMGDPAQDKELMAFAKKITESVKTPVEKYQEEIGKLQAAFGAKMIDAKTFERGKVQALFDSGLVKKSSGNGDRGDNEVKHAAAVDLFSNEGYSAILKGMTGSGGRDGKIEMANQQKLTIAREGVGVQRQILNVLNGRQVVPIRI